MGANAERDAAIKRICAMKEGDWCGMTLDVVGAIADRMRGPLGAPFRGDQVPDALLEALPVTGVNYGNFTAEFRPHGEQNVVIVRRHRPRTYRVRNDLDRKHWSLPQPVRCPLCGGSGQARYWRPASIYDAIGPADITAESVVEMPEVETCRTCNGHGLVGARAATDQAWQRTMDCNQRGG